MEKKVKEVGKKAMPMVKKEVKKAKKAKKKK